jgi:hypothetical protein
MSPCAPIALFIFNRPEHLARALTSLATNPDLADSPVYVFADGPREPADEVPVAAARRVAMDFLGKRAEYRFRTSNAGLAESIIAGVSELTEEFGRTIVLEDDLVVAPDFLRYMNEALVRYSDASNVYQVSGYMFRTRQIAARRRAVFLPIISTWGWGTWKRAWSAFDAQALGWEKLRTDARLRRRFNIDGAYDYSSMLERQVKGAVSSWGIRWYWSVFRRGGLVCYPPQSRVANTGMDGSGTHGRGRLRSFDAPIELRAGDELEFPETPIVHATELAEVRRAIWQQNGGWPGFAVNRLRALQWALRGA